MPQVKQINHVAVVVDDMEKALAFWRDALGIEMHELRDVPAEKSQVAFLPLPGSEVELVKPTTDDSGIAKYLAKRGPGMHHLCLEVDDINANDGSVKNERNPPDQRRTSHGSRWKEIRLHPSRKHGRGAGGVVSTVISATLRGGAAGTTKQSHAPIQRRDCFGLRPHNPGESSRGKDRFIFPCSKTSNSTLREKCGLNPDLPIIAGVSGGPDSLCLMSVLRKAGYRIIVAHFNHKLRPELRRGCQYRGADRGACLDLASVIQSGDVRAFADSGKLSIEEAARILRYRFLMEQARHFHAQAVAVGHTADDQVETVLMHFIRGAGLAGLKGMNYRTIIQMFDPEIPVVRPLLDLWREETVVYCATHGFRPRHDPSNASLDFSATACATC